MIPLTVCQTDQPELYLQALSIVAFALVLGSAIGWRSRGRHWFFSAIVAAVSSFAFPLAAVFSVWPFDGRWRYDCGATPDPNIWAYYALLGSVPIAIAASLMIRRTGQK